MMTPAQCRAARAMLDWSQQQLAEASKVGNATIRNFEGGKSAPQNATLDVLRRALEAAGVIFVDENGEGPGIRMRKAAPSNGEARTKAKETTELKETTEIERHARQDAIKSRS